MDEKEKIMLFYDYRMVYNDIKSRETYIGKVRKNKMVRPYSFFDLDGWGYIYPYNTTMSDVGVEGKEGEYNIGYEYEVRGKCSCCFECMNNNDCEENLKCSDNVCVECENDMDCSNDDNICSEYGKCLQKGLCRSDQDCEKTEYCDYNGNCTKGCKHDGFCKSNEMCIDFECSSNGCKDNFDCKDYDHVCIDDICMYVGDSDCQNNSECGYGYYCDYEYLICVKDRRGITMKERIENYTCSYYDVISHFMIASSYDVASNTAKDKLINECGIKCANKYYAFSDIQIDDINVMKLKKIG